LPYTVRSLSPQGHKNYKNQNLCLPRKREVSHEKCKPSTPSTSPPYNKNYYGDKTPSKRSYQSFSTNEKREGNRDTNYPVVHAKPINDFDERLIEIEKMS